MRNRILAAFATLLMGGAFAVVVPGTADAAVTGTMTAATTDTPDHSNFTWTCDVNPGGTTVYVMGRSWDQANGANNTDTVRQAISGSVPVRLTFKRDALDNSSYGYRCLWYTTPTTMTVLGKIATALFITTGTLDPPPANIALGHFRNRPQDSALTWQQRQASVETTYGPLEGHWRNFKPAGSDGKLIAAELTALTDGKRIFDNWKVTANGSTWAQMAAGSRDAAITAAAQQWETACGSAVPDRCWLTPWHEPENDTGAAGSGMTATDYVAFYQHFSTVWRASAPDVKLVWTAMGFDLPLSAQFWPGAAYVDYIGHDPYIRCGSTPTNLAADMVNHSTWFRANLPGAAAMKVVIPEWGTSLGSTATSPACGQPGGERDTDAHRQAAIDGITARIADLRAAGVIELDMFDSGTDSLTDTGVDATAYRNLKIATES